MLELMDSLPEWLLTRGSGPCAVATIVATDGSVPRPLGTSMLVSGGGEVLGSLSGGCVEGAVIEAALESMDSGLPRREQFRYTADDAFAAGLTCGGSLEVRIQPYLASIAAGSDQVDAGSAGVGELRALALAMAGAGGGFPALITRLDDGGGRAVVVHDPQAISEQDLHAELIGLLGAGVARRAVGLMSMLRAGQSGLLKLADETGECTDNPPTLLVESRLPPPRMLIFGSNDFSAALLPAAQLLGYHVTLCDARPVFARQERFRHADQVAVNWPHHYLRAEAEAGRIDGRTVVCVLSHDPKFDVPLLAVALELELAYLGAMGSRRSHQDRVAALLEGGADPEKIARMHAPIGLDLGAVTAAEVAVSIAAEIVACRRGAASHPSGGAGVGGAESGGAAAAVVRSAGTGAAFRSLKDGTGVIHSGTSLPDALVPGAVKIS
ncbi:XdhC family protein [Paenarthrobacter sp. Z7-10]|uniref:XdhC family protein n=1 Tax=Paenarthrobacter sp. Z7-10 TaxID=2787635 RepID=UPI0022A92F0B|nr:XdhC/CoxI family protein [Paenarthrobacter sp. Z7-10]MCZ2403848.1 XdhC family protein [Paenarthrobacter sp. Z7-10]